MMIKSVLGLLMLSLANAWGDVPRLVPIYHEGVSSYYVEGDISGYGPTRLLVDTGAGFTAINEATLAVLNEGGHARFVDNVLGVMVDGTQRVMPIYRITGINIGGECWVRDIDAVILPGNTRPILGMNVMIKVSPFTWSVDPPSLLLSNCGRVR